MNQPQFVINRVASPQQGRLEIVFADGFSGEVDLHDLIEKHPSLARLKDAEVFADVVMDEWNRGVIFAGEDALSLASDNLRALAVEQAGGYSHQQVINWMHHHGMSLEVAANALGISRRMLAYYRSAECPIPKTVGLAMLGWEALKNGHHLNEYAKVA